MRAISIVIVAAVALTACDAEQFRPINIAVYPSHKMCAIKDTPIACEKLTVYLHDVLKASKTREITVSYAGTETVEKGDTSIEQIAELIRTAGYTNVRAVRFDMK